MFPTMKKLELDPTLEVPDKRVKEKLQLEKKVPEAEEEVEAAEAAEALEVEEASEVVSVEALEAAEVVLLVTFFLEMKTTMVTDLPEEDTMMSSTDLLEEPMKKDINPEVEVATEVTTALDKTSKEIDILEKTEVPQEVAEEPEVAPENLPEAEASEILS